MGYETINKLHQFSLQHGALLSCKKSDGDLCMEIDGAIATYDNEHNDRSVNTCISTLFLRLSDARVEELLLEGYKYYDADGNLMSEVEDKPMNPEELPAVMQLCEGGYIAGEDLLEKADERYYLQLQVDAVDSNDTYCMTFSFTKSSAKWERFQQKAEDFYFQF